ncbi:hypothetical protein [Paraflavitalea speifideaquila]|uniref:hypothetical protein n=1 Tax=Paraflavitalea speifideaquila TaxID=3076558 RepID=UPI0028E98903|nr:hypothetical protein [Paraflavitalea speifideiaquila]
MTGTITHDMGGKQYKITIDKNVATGLMIDGVKVPKGKLPGYRDVINTLFRQMQADAAVANGARTKEANDKAQLAIDQANLQKDQLQLQGQLSPLREDKLSLKPITLEPKITYSS